VDKSSVVVPDDDPGSCDEAPGVVDGSGHDRDGGSAAGGKIAANSARVGPTNAIAFLVAVLPDLQ
jgi:hypothetical protein